MLWLKNRLKNSVSKGEVVDGKRETESRDSWGRVWLDSYRINLPISMDLRHHAVNITGAPMAKAGSSSSVSTCAISSFVTSPALTASSRICSKLALFNRAPGDS